MNKRVSVLFWLIILKMVEILLRRFSGKVILLYGLWTDTAIRKEKGLTILMDTSKFIFVMVNLVYLTRHVATRCGNVHYMAQFGRGCSASLVRLRLRTCAAPIQPRSYVNLCVSFFLFLVVIAFFVAFPAWKITKHTIKPINRNEKERRETLGMIQRKRKIQIRKQKFIY